MLALHAERSDVIEACSASVHPALSHLRFAMLTCRASARIETFEACASFTPAPDQALAGYAKLLVRVLTREMASAPVFFAPGTEETSFDEHWILRVLNRIADGDSDSLYFLIASRTSRAQCRSIATLFRAVERLAA